MIYLFRIKTTITRLHVENNATRQPRQTHYPNVAPTMGLDKMLDQATEPASGLSRDGIGSNQDELKRSIVPDGRVAECWIDWPHGTSIHKQMPDACVCLRRVAPLFVCANHLRTIASSEVGLPK